MLSVATVAHLYLPSLILVYRYSLLRIVAYRCFYLFVVAYRYLSLYKVTVQDPCCCWCGNQCGPRVLWWLETFGKLSVKTECNCFINTLKHELQHIALFIHKKHMKRRCNTSTSLIFEHVIFKRVCQCEACFMIISKPSFGLCFIKEKRHCGFVESAGVSVLSTPYLTLCRHEST